MSKLNVEILEIDKTAIYGLSKISNDKTIAKDITELSKQYKDIVKNETVLPYFILSKNYNEQTKDFEMLVGGTLEGKQLEQYIISKGKYAKITIKPKFGFLWGLSVGEAKRYFYTDWIKSSNYKPLNMEYEYHTEKSIGKKPTIDIIFSISDK
jgi:Bacterial transcription activator, effector binding domain.